GHEVRAAVRDVSRARRGGRRVGGSGPARLVSPDAAAVMRATQALWPLALLAIFVATFQRSAPEAATGGAAAPCTPHGGNHAADAVARLERCLALDPGDVESMIAL